MLRGGQYYIQRQLQQRGREVEDESCYDYVNVNGDTAAESGVIYADIVAHPQSADTADKGHDKITSSNLTNEDDDDAVIYSDLQNTEADIESLEEPDALYANV